jgi:hypothetical protein
MVNVFRRLVVMESGFSNMDGIPKKKSEGNKPIGFILKFPAASIF